MQSYKFGFNKAYKRNRCIDVGRRIFARISFEIGRSCNSCLC